MIAISATEAMPASASATWDLLTDWAAHSRWVPATTVVVEHDTGGIGTRFVGRSRFGPVAFDDPMTVTEFVPPSATGPGECAIRKTGRVVRGTAGFTVSGDSPHASTVTWWEDVEVAPTWLTRWFAPVVARAGSVAFGRVLRAAAAELAER
jgi:hypothetical protein